MGPIDASRVGRECWETEVTNNSENGRARRPSIWIPPVRRVCQAARCLAWCLLWLAVGVTACHAQTSSQPNIVFILADDMGLGDVRSYAANSPVETSNIDRIAERGMRFTNAHSPSAVCSPTRYGLLTGRYAWRTRLKSGVVSPHEPALIDDERPTVADLLKQRGYATAAFGKWHLGMNWATNDGRAPTSNGSNVDYSQPFRGGPTDHGFDVYYGDDIINWAPFTFIQDDQTIGIPTEPFGNGLRTPGYEQIDSLPNYTNRTVEYINERANRTEPFFVYMPLTAPHSPIVPPDFIPDVGTNYDQFITTVDWAVGQVLDALQDNGIDEKTVVVFASDNGVSKNFSTSDDISPGFVNGIPLRGQKADIWEAGHRIPLMVRWDGHVDVGSINDEYVELNDFYATVAEIVGQPLPPTVAEDSYSLLRLLEGEALKGPLREAGVNHSINGTFAIRRVDEQGDEWKLIFNSGSGGWTSPSGTKVDPQQADLTNNLANLQLYNVTADPGETNDFLSGTISPESMATVVELHEIMRGYLLSNRSAPAPILGDLNTDGRIDVADWGIYLDGLNTDLSDLSVLETYGLGDLNGDLLNNHDDFWLFRQSYEMEHGKGSFSAMLAAVPEPSTCGLLAWAAAALAGVVLHGR